MESFINAPTRIFTEVHGKKTFLSLSSTSSSSAVSWRREICLTKSSNRTRHGHLQASSPHPKTFHSFHFSNSEVGSGTETAKTNIPQTDGSKVALVRLQLKKECQYGEHFLVVGDEPVLGSWNPLKAIPLSWSDGHVWTVDLELPVGKTIQYKLIRKLSTADIVWQPGPNRTIQVGEGQNVAVVREDWENAEAKSICIERQIIKKEKPIVDTLKMKTSKHSGESSFLEKKPMVRAINGFNISDSASTAHNTDHTSIINTKREGLGTRDPESLKKKPCISAGKMGRSAKGMIKEELPTRRSSHILARNNESIADKEYEGESLVIYNEGHVLVPGLTVHVTTEEAGTEEPKNSNLASSSNEAAEPINKAEREDEAECLVTYDEGRVLVPGLTAPMITEEALTKELQNSIVTNSLNGGDKSRNNSISDIPQRW